MSYLHDDEDWPAIHPAVIASTQIAEAMNDIDRHPDLYLRWPYPHLDAMTGPLGAGGDLWFVCAFSGGGKTTFVCSTIELWRAQGKRIYVMPLETQAKRFRTYLACMQSGVHPGDAFTGQLRAPGREAERKAVLQALTDQGKKPYVEQVMVSEAKMIDVRGLEAGLKEAKAFGADVVIVDHIDHIDATGGKSLYEASREVNQKALDMAQANNLLIVFTSQLNLEIARGHDHLARYQPPREGHVLMGNQKRSVATGMIGLFRKVRDRQPDESPEDYTDAIRQARAGTTEAPKVLDPGVMGVNAMKLRHYGSRDGSRIYLGYEHGRVIPLAEKDRYQTGFGGRVQEVYRG
jgi:hypothetical protein